MKRISGSIFSLLLAVAWAQPCNGQDTLRTFGPRIGIDLSRFAYYFTDPPVKGVEFSLDFEVYKNIFPVLEVGFAGASDQFDEADYRSEGPYARAGMDYNLFPVKDRNVHHAISLGFLYGTSVFTHRAEQITVSSDYWGDWLIYSYENRLHGHWIELVGGIKAELAPNFFLGWSIRYKILLNPGMDPQITPLLIPGYGQGAEDRGVGFSYSLLYKIPLIKK